MHQAVCDINARYRETPALWALDNEPAGFEWLVADDADANVFAFARRDGSGSQLVAVSNFSAAPHERYRLRFPVPGVWDEVLNTDATGYGGAGVRNLGRVDVPEDGHAQVALPPLGTVWFRRAA